VNDRELREHNSRVFLAGQTEVMARTKLIPRKPPYAIAPRKPQTLDQQWASMLRMTRH
jgi:hypothetical protein